MTIAIRKLGDTLLETTIDDDVVVMRLADGSMFEMQHTAREIWALIDGNRTRDAIVAELEQRHGTQPAIAADTDAFLGELRNAGLIG